jgi:hypothetical protein
MTVREKPLLIIIVLPLTLGLYAKGEVYCADSVWGFWRFEGVDGER